MDVVSLAAEIIVYRGTSLTFVNQILIQELKETLPEDSLSIFHWYRVASGRSKSNPFANKFVTSNYHPFQLGSGKQEHSRHA